MKTSSGRPVQWRLARSRWRSRRSRRRGVVRARRRGDLGTVAAGATVNGGERARAEGNGGEREGDLAGEKAQRPRESGGEWERGPRERGRWRPYPLAGFTAGEGVRRRRSPVPTRSGEQEGDAGRGGGLGRGAAAGGGPAWAGGVWAAGPVGGERALFPLLPFLFCFLFSLICLFPFLFYFI